MKWVARALTVAFLLAAVAAAARAPAAPGDVAVGIAKGKGLKPCGAVRIRGAEARGGCDLEVDESTAKFTVLTMFGDHTFGRCAMTFRLRIGGTGNIAATDVELTPFGAQANICGDVLPCRRKVSDGMDDPPELPWKGAIGTDGDRLRADLDVCFDTCLGRFEGKTRFGIARTPGGLRMTADRAALGTSGFEVSGRWTMRPFFGGELQLLAPDGHGRSG